MLAFQKKRLHMNHELHLVNHHHWPPHYHHWTAFHSSSDFRESDNVIGNPIQKGVAADRIEPLERVRETTHESTAATFRQENLSMGDERSYDLPIDPTNPTTLEASHGID